MSCFVVPLFVWACMGESHGFPIENVGNDRRGIEGVGHDGRPARPLCHTAGLFVIPPVLSVIPAGPLCHARRPLSVMPPGPLCHSRRFPLSFSCPPASLCHSRRLLAGIQCLALLFLYSCGPCMEEAMDSRLKMSGMTEEGLNNVGHDGRHALPLCHARRPLSVMPAGFPDNKRRGQG